MEIEDRVHGKINIDDPLAIELINSKPFQRLKRITLAGIKVFLNPKHFYARFETTRYEHSLGVYALLKRFNASRLEQIAGLLHDISIPAFSHCIDFLYGRAIEQDFHEKFHEHILLNSEIQEILKKHRIEVEEVLKGNFSLLDTEIPNICADRIDYSLRDLVCVLKVDRSKVKNLIDSLIVHAHELIFADHKSARQFAYLYLKIGELYNNPLQATIFKLISETIKMGLRLGIVKEEELFVLDEPSIHAKLVKAKDSNLQNLLQTISTLRVKESQDDYDFHLKCKIRYVDPKVLVEGKIKRVSELEPEFKRRLQSFIARRAKGFYVKIIPNESKRNFR